MVPNLLSVQQEATMNRERWEIRKSEDGQFYAVLLANNNRIICTTEIMHRRRDVLRGIESVRRNAGAQVIELHG